MSSSKPKPCRWYLLLAGKWKATPKPESKSKSKSPKPPLDVSLLCLNMCVCCWVLGTTKLGAIPERSLYRKYIKYKYLTLLTQESNDQAAGFHQLSGQIKAISFLNYIYSIYSMHIYIYRYIYSLLLVSPCLPAPKAFAWHLYLVSKAIISCN